MAIVGIDLGTTNSLISVFKDGKCLLIPNSFEEILTPSVVCVNKEEVIVGKLAREKLITQSENTFAVFKLFMGTQKLYIIGERKYTSTDLSSMVIKQLVNDAEKYLGEKVEEAIISVPAYFDDAKRQATKQAGELAGIKVERIINEPSAAALATRMGNSEFETLLVFDLGGGTLDVSVIDCFEDVVEIVSVSGDNHLGGENFNFAIENHFISKYRISILSLKDKAILSRNVEEMKKELAYKDDVDREIHINNQQYMLTLSREILFQIAQDLLYKIKSVIGKALVDSDKTVEDIDRLVMVGGSSRLIVVQEYLEYLFHKKVEITDNVDYLVGLGCGYVAGIKERKEEIRDKVLTDICPFSLGVDIFNPHGRPLYSIIIERNTTLPCSHNEYYYTVHDNQNQISVNVYQGEEIYAEENTFLGNIEIKIPKNKAGMESIEVRFTYDINGILDVEVMSVTTKEIEHRVFTSDGCVLSEKEIREKVIELEKLKIRDNLNEIDFLLESAKRLFEESIGEKRNYLYSIITEIEQLKKKNKILQFEKRRKEIEKILRELDNQSPFIYEDDKSLH